jgi:hypothetical protein
LKFSLVLEAIGITQKLNVQDLLNQVETQRAELEMVSADLVREKTSARSYQKAEKEARKETEQLMNLMVSNQPPSQA